MQFKWNKALAEGKSAMIDLGKSVATAVLPILESLIKSLRKLIEWFNSLSEEQRQSTLKWIAFAAAIGPLALVISTLGLAINGFIKILGTLGTALRIVKLALLTNPWTALATVVAGIVGYFIHLRNKAEDAAKANNKLTDSLVAVEGVMKSLKDLEGPDYSKMSLNELTAANMAAYNSAKQAEAEFNRLEKLRTANPRHNRAYDVLEDPVVIQWENAKRVYQETNKAIDEFSKRQPQIKSIVTSSTDGIVNGLENAKSKLDKFFEDYIEKIQELNRKTSINTYIPDTGFYEKFFMRTTSFANRKDVDIMNQLGNDLTFVIKKEEALGQTLGMNRDLFNQTSGFINAYSKALENLLDIPVSAWDQQWYENLQKVTEELSKAQKEYQKLMTAQSAVDTLANAFSQLFDSIIEGGQNMGQVLGNILKGILKELAAAIAKMIAMKIIMSIINPGGAFMSNFGSILPNMQTGRFAKGGVVPSGYPGDTYPALLSSGEMVLPKGIAESISKPSMMEGEVRFEIEGDRLVGILRKQGKKNSIY